MKVFLGLISIAHGLVHGGLAAAPDPADPDAKPLAFFTSLERSRILTKAGASPEAARWIGICLVVLSLIGFVLTGIGILTTGGLHGFWQGIASISALSSLLLLITFWHPWLVLGIGLDIGTLVLLVLGWGS